MPAAGANAATMAAIQRERAADASAANATGNATAPRQPTRNDPAFRAKRRVEASDMASFKSSASLASSYAGGGLRGGASGDDEWGNDSFVSRKSNGDDEDDSMQRSKSQSNAFAVGLNTNSRVLKSQSTVNNLLSYQTLKTRLGQSSTHRERERRTFFADVERTRRQLRTMHRFILDPNSRFIRRWDFVTLTALMITIFITPWEVSFLPQTSTEDWKSRPITFVVNRCVDTVSLSDALS